MNTRTRRIAMWITLVALGIGGLAFAEPETTRPADAGQPSSQGPTGDKDGVKPESRTNRNAPDNKDVKEGAAAKDDQAKNDTGADGKATQDAAKSTQKYAAPTPKALPKLADDEGRNSSVLVIPIKGTIDLGLAPFVKRSLDNGRKASAIIFDVDTFGGRVDAAVQIRDAILGTTVPTIAYVNRRAISAGALISLAADYIVFAPGASMGAATPVQLEGGQAKAVGEKMVSYMRSEMRATAEAKGRDGQVAEAMVDADVEIPGVSAKGKLLTMTTKQALEWGVANGKFATQRDLLDSLQLGRAEVVTQTANWAENVARFLTDPVVSGLLMSLGMLGLLLELYTPGFGFAGGLGLMCLMMFFGGHMVTNIAGWEEVALFGVGLLALGAEVFIIPGFGIAGVLGLGLIGTALAMSMVGLPISTSWDTGVLQVALTTVVISLVTTSIVAIIIIRYLPDTSIGRWLVLETTLGGTASGALPADGEAWEVSSDDKRLYIDARGMTTTDLRPAGKVQVGDTVLDVVSRDTWIPRHTPVKVVQVEGIRIVVVEDRSS